MLTRFINWWIRNSIYIAPIGSAISALAATASVYLTRRTFLQARKDRQEELEAKRPKFVIDAELLLTDGNPEPFYVLKLTLNNIGEHSAHLFDASGAITHDAAYKPSLSFEKRPAEAIHPKYPFDMFIDLAELDASNKPYHLSLKLKYADSRTSKRYDNQIQRKFFVPFDNEDGLPMSVPVSKLDLPERKQLLEARGKLIDKDWKETMAAFVKLIKES